ncbi:MAG TPA: M20/M25/M40 family metallo-hydrolase, partial [Nannocystis sp.]
MAPTPPRGPGPLLLALGLLALGLVVVRLRLEPPPALPSDAPADRFSAGRALDRLATLVGDDVPHPVGSPAADRVRARLLAEFTALGIPAEVQQGFACSARGASCGDVGNVVARLPGTHAGPAVLVSAHHDSVAAGPGAGDDGAGVSAVLELARVLSQGPAPKNPVVFLLVDGEEAGLLGAQAFIDDHPHLKKDIGVTVNLDAGGTRGVTSITRTSPGNARVIDAFTAAVPRPYGASVIGAVYGLTPYDTDFSVYSKAEIASIDLGFGEDKAHYHTPLDRLANLDPPSVQHLGDTALALVRALANADLESDAPGERVFLDALGLTMLAWPAPWTPIFAALAVALLALATWRMRHVPGASSLNAKLLAAGSLPLLLAAPALLAGGLAWLLALLTQAEVPGHAQPWPARVAIWSAALLASGLTTKWLTTRLGTARLTLALWWSLALLTAALAIAAPD